jgi:hypothetical protein
MIGKNKERMDFDKSKLHVVGVQSDIETSRPRMFGFYSLYYNEKYVGDVKNTSDKRWNLSATQLQNKAIELLGKSK